MAISGKDIEIVVGVEGGASLSTGSGKQIKESLDGIFKQLDPKLDLKLDTTKIARNIEKDIKKVLSDVNVEIGKVQAQWVKLGETMKISIPMSNTKTGESYQYLAEANVDAKKLSGALQSVAQDYAALQKSADAAYDKLIKNVQKRLEYQKQMKTADSDSWGYQQAEKAKQAIEDENKSLIKLIANIQKLGVESSKADEYADAKNAAKSELLRYDAYVKRLAKQEEATERAKVQAAAEKELDAVYAELIKKENELLPLEKALFSNEEGTTKYKQAERECEAVIEEVAALKERADVLEKNGAVSQKAEEYNKAYTESAIRLVEYIDDLAAKEEQLAEKEAQLAAQRERSDSTERAKENMRLAQEEATERAKAQAAAEKAAAAEQKAADASISAEKAKASAIAAAEKKIETALSWTAAANTKEYKAIVAASQELQNAEGLTENRIKELTTVIDQNSTAIRMAGNAHQSLGDQLTKNASKFTAWLGTSQLVMKAIQTIKKMITNVTELDTAMTELKKVTDETDETYGRFLDNAAEKAKSIGTTMTDFVNATASFARLGFGVEDASTLAEVATIYKNVGDGISTIDEASESIISTMQAFGVETSNVISIVDKFNNVGNNFAISSGGIGEAMLNSASAMHAANNTLDETIALITAANKVVQNPQKVGTALKTMSMYLRAAKTEAEEAGESTEGMANSVSELREEILKLTGNKVDIQIDENTFKSTYQILKELSEVWGELSDISQANILEMIGGKRGANVGSALIENFSVAEEALATSLDSVGSAVKENEKYLDSIEGRISQFKATFQDFSNDFVSSDLLKNIISFGTGALGVLDSIVEKMSALEIAASIGATASLIKFAGALKTALKAGTELSVAMKAAAASNWVTLALTALPLIIELIDKLTVSSGELIENANDIISTFDSAKTSYKNNISAIEDLRDEYEQLSQGVDENGNNISLTADEYDRYHEIISKIVDISPSVVQGYNKEGDAIVNYKGLIDDAIESQEEFLNNQTLIYLGQGTDIFEGKKKEYEDALDGLEGSFTRIAEAANDSADQMIGEFFENLIMHGVDALKMANDTKTTAWRDAMKQIGMDENFYLNGVQASDVEQLTTLYERRAQFIDALRSTEKYSEEELTALNAAIVQLGTDFDNLRKIQEEQINYLLTYAKQNTDVDTGWFLEIPDGAVDNFKNGLFDVIDSTKTCTENLQILNQYGREFADVFGSRDVQSVLAMADGLKDGSVSVEDYNAKVSQLEGRLEYMGPICDTIIGYLRELTNVGNEGGGALEGISGQVETVGDSLSEYIELLDDLEDKFGLIETAQKEMEDAGSISVSTIQKLQEATEDYLDYLYVEDGQIKLNTKSWYEFCTAKSKAALIEYKSRLSELQAERQNIIGCISAADDFGDSTTELKGKQAELETQIAETELIIGIMESTMHGLTEVTDEASDETEELATAWDNASGALSRFSSGLSDIRSAYTTLKTAVDEYNSSGSLTYDTLLSLIKLDPQYLACLRAENDRYSARIHGFSERREGVCNRQDCGDFLQAGYCTDVESPAVRPENPELRRREQSGAHGVDAEHREPPRRAGRQRKREQRKREQRKRRRKQRR